MAPKIRVRILSSLVGVTETKGRAPLFQEGFAVSGKRFVHGRVLGVRLVWAPWSNRG
jgi:hypothetical protein